MVRWYFGTTVIYGFSRAVTYDYKGEKLYFNRNMEKFETKKMLTVDNFSRIVHNSLAACFVWPSMLADDIKLIECGLKGKDPAEYE